MTRICSDLVDCVPEFRRNVTPLTSVIPLKGQPGLEFDKFHEWLTLIYSVGKTKCLTSMNVCMHVLLSHIREGSTG